MMYGERIPETRTMGNNNSPHQYGYFSGGSHRGFGVLGPRRERHNRIAKQRANKQRRKLNKELIRESA